jgi:putative toxin-antitoxin system antitoxin component (TIGR02293 family)
MNAQAAGRRKSVLAEEFLDVGGDPLAKIRGAYTNLILPKSQGHDVVRELSKGVTGRKAEQFRKKAGLDETSFSSIIGYSRMHYSRLAKDGSKLLRGTASNRLYRLAQVLEHAIELYNGDELTALRWLKTPNVAFGNTAPLEMMASEVGSDMVDTLISQLELGILPG